MCKLLFEMFLKNIDHEHLKMGDLSQICRFWSKMNTEKEGKMKHGIIINNMPSKNRDIAGMFFCPPAKK